MPFHGESCVINQSINGKLTFTGLSRSTLISGTAILPTGRGGMGHEECHTAGLTSNVEARISYQLVRAWLAQEGGTR